MPPFDVSSSNSARPQYQQQIPTSSLQMNTLRHQELKYGQIHTDYHSFEN